MSIPEGLLDGLDLFLLKDHQWRRKGTMELMVFSLFDSQTKTYERPFMARAKGEALRLFADAVNSSEKTPYSKHPEDYTLFLLGSWDDDDASYEMCPAPERLICGHELIQKA